MRAHAAQSLWVTFAEEATAPRITHGTTCAIPTSRFRDALIPAAPTILTRGTIALALLENRPRVAYVTADDVRTSVARFDL